MRDRREAAGSGWGNRRGGAASGSVAGGRHRHRDAQGQALTVSQNDWVLTELFLFFTV